MDTGRDQRAWLLLPEPVRRLPADLAVVVFLVVVTVGAALLPGVSESPLRVVFGLPFVLFVPGYAFIAALFPEAGERVDDVSERRSDADRAEHRAGIDGIERVALSFGTSIAVVPLLGLVLNFTPWGVRLVPVLVAISAFTLGGVAVAAQRRWELPEAERFAVPYERWVASARAELLEPDSRADAALNVVLVCSLLLAVASVGYATAVPKQGEAFTEFYLLTEDEDGELVADDYPTEFVRGESKHVIVGIGNHEHERTNYAAVVELQRVAFAKNSTHVLETEEVGRFRATVAPNGTWRTNHTITPTMTGERLRLTYMLYRGTTPANPTAENAYRELHLWVNVTTSATNEATSPSQTGLNRTVTDSG